VYQVLVGGCIDGQVKLWDLYTGLSASSQDASAGEEGHSGGISAMDIPRNAPHVSDAWLLTASIDKKIKLWASLPMSLSCVQTWVGHKVR
jgi:WD40 repeat protein